MSELSSSLVSIPEDSVSTSHGRTSHGEECRRWRQKSNVLRFQGLSDSNCVGNPWSLYEDTTSCQLQDAKISEANFKYVLNQLNEICDAMEFFDDLKQQTSKEQPEIVPTAVIEETLFCDDETFTSASNTQPALKCDEGNDYTFPGGLPALKSARAIQRILARRYTPVDTPTVEDGAATQGDYFDHMAKKAAFQFVAHHRPQNETTSASYDVKHNHCSNLKFHHASPEVSPSSASTYVVDHWDILSSCTPPSSTPSPARHSVVSVGNAGSNCLAVSMPSGSPVYDTSHRYSRIGGGYNKSSTASHQAQMDVKLAPEVFLPPSLDVAGFDSLFTAGFGGVCDILSETEESARTSVTKTSRTERRRHTADCEQLHAELERRVRTARRSQRRRKSIDDSTLAMAALHAYEMQGLREFQSPHSALCGVGRGILRSQSTFCVTDKGSDRNTRSRQVQGKVGKQNSLTPISPSTINDSWPASITSMLACGQSIRDRLFLFCQIEKFLTQFARPHSSSIEFTAGQLESGYAATEAGSTLSSASTAASLPQKIQSHNITRRKCTNSIFQMSSDFGSSMYTATQLSGAQTKKSGAGDSVAPQLSECVVPSRRISGLRILSAAWSIPRPDKKWKGEDAYFLADWADGFIGIADGVGEWCDLGSNPRKFAEEFMQGSKRAAERQYLKARKLTSHGRSFNSPAILQKSDSAVGDHEVNQRASARAMKVLQEGYNSTKSYGSATALVAGLDHEGRTLGLANIGDSALIVFRRESRRHRHFTVCRRTKEQQHFFNCPYQLSRIPTQADLPELQRKGMHRLVKVIHNLQSNYEGDTPEMADPYDIKLQEGDLIIAATDGLLDNLFDREVASLVSLCLSPYEAAILSRAGLHNEADRHSFPHPNSVILPDYHKEFGFATPPINVARALAEAAFYRSIDPTVKTPFAVQSRRAGGFFSGGKMDDITVVAMWVV